jgi:hypothetical protein
MSKNIVHLELKIMRTEEEASDLSNAMVVLRARI